MTKPPLPGWETLPADDAWRLEKLCSDFEGFWKTSQQPQIEDYLPKVAEAERPYLLRELLRLELAYRRKNNETPSAEKYRLQFRDHVELVDSVFGEAPNAPSDHSEFSDPSAATEPHVSDSSEAAPPKLPDRYRVLTELGRGNGIVYKAYDGELQLDVAIKVPNPEAALRPGYTETFKAEARVLARLDHPHIVRVHNVGQTDDGLPFVVYKYIEGSDLKKKTDQGRMGINAAAELLAVVAEALHYAHGKGLVHRDIKPGNILIDNAGKAYIADFGIALREQDFGTGPEFAGTIPYMSPEQARHEGHRVDPRSDVFSLGVVFYELLTGRRPFLAATRAELLEQIIFAEPRPLRHVDDTIPKELERICLKAMAKKASERYLTGSDLAEDLRNFLAARSAEESHHGAPAPGASPEPSKAPGAAPALTSTSEPVKIVPKGIRSFDSSDADFFLELLPGPRDRAGLPDSIRFWKSRIEQRDPDQGFTVGLIYGPSGCGKSSLVKAGLLPRLAGHVISVYVEATASETEARLLKGLRKNCLDLPAELGLIETVTALRRGRGIPDDKKVLIVLDQFEQWLHANPAMDNVELIQGLRQCDGGRVQCLVMVRDDFWMAATQFFREMEIRLVEGQNSAAVDLFDLRHARKVLAAFGQAAGALPENAAERTSEQNAFLDQAVAGLAQAEKVVCVRLAVFAEMVKGKTWTPEILRKLGGTTGVGTTFLEDTFSAAGASPERRLHQKAARAVLKALLPESGSNIKGQMRSYAELQALSGYSTRPTDFDDLLRILDGELRLITPTDPEDTEADSRSPQQAQAGQKYYQLTHDYLVHSLRNWLTHKQKETRQGRAELRLEELTALWTANQRQRRFLPSLPEFLLVSFSVPRRNLKPEARALLRSAARHHAVSWGLSLTALFVVCVIIGAWVSHAKNLQLAEHLVNGVLDADPNDVQVAIERLKPQSRRAMPLLRSQFKESLAGSKRKLHAAFALAALGEPPEKFLIEALATSPSNEARNMLTALSDAQMTVKTVAPRLRQQVQVELSPDARARCAMALLDLGDTVGAEHVLALGPDPASRTAFIHSFGAWHGQLDSLPRLLTASNDGALQSGLCAALGLMDANTVTPHERDALGEVLERLYRESPDGGVHGAAGWALRQWNRKLPTLEIESQARAGRNWFVNRHGMTLVQVRPGTFTMGGDPKLDDWKPHEVTLTRPFFIGDREVTLDLFRQFLADQNYSGEKPRDWYEPPAPTSGDAPVRGVSWVNAVLFCNWLSYVEKRTTCYEREKEGAGWTCDFNANGYRLPTEAEWEYACRAMTTTAYSFGEDPKHLLDYGYFNRNSDLHEWPGATKLPNGWGLFDMHGNLAEWCWDWYGGPAERSTDPQGPPRGNERVIRGGAFLFEAERTRSGRNSDKFSPARGFPTIGFRVVCTQAKGS